MMKFNHKINPNVVEFCQIFNELKLKGFNWNLIKKVQMVTYLVVYISSQDDFCKNKLYL